MREILALSVGGRYARASGARRDTSGQIQAVPLEIEQSVDGVRRVVLDRLATSACRLDENRWATGQYAREVLPCCPGSAVVYEDLAYGRTKQDYTTLIALAEFLKYLYRSVSRGTGKEHGLALLYKDEDQRRWLERAAVLAGLPVLAGGLISVVRGLEAGLHLRGVEAAGGPVGVLEMGGSGSTLFLLHPDGSLRWLGACPSGGAAALAGVLSDELFPDLLGHPGLATAVDDFLEGLVYSGPGTGGSVTGDAMEFYLPGEEVRQVSPDRVLEVLEPHFTNGPGSLGAFLSGCLESAGVSISRLVLVGGVACLGLPGEFFPIPVEVPFQPERVDVDGAAVLANEMAGRGEAWLPMERSRWEKERVSIQQLCHIARQEAISWKNTCREKEQELEDAREQLTLQKMVAGSLQQKIDDLQSQLADQWLKLKETEDRLTEKRFLNHAARERVKTGASTPDGADSELERLRKRCRHLEKRLRQAKENQVG